MICVAMSETLLTSLFDLPYDTAPCRPDISIPLLFPYNLISRFNKDNPTVSYVHFFKTILSTLTIKVKTIYFTTAFA